MTKFHLKNSSLPIKVLQRKNRKRDSQFNRRQLDPTDKDNKPDSPVQNGAEAQPMDKNQPERRGLLRRDQAEDVQEDHQLRQAALRLSVQRKGQPQRRERAQNNGVELSAALREVQLFQSVVEGAGAGARAAAFRH